MAKKLRRQRTPAQKQKFLDNHFLYEVRELNWCVGFYLSTQLHRVGKDLDVERFMVNTALDHALLHARNLTEFFYERHASPKYARALEFVPTWGPPRKPKAVVKFEKRVHPEIAHLTWDRPFDDEHKTWPLDEVAIPVLGAAVDFTDALDPVYLSDRIRVLRGETAAVIAQIKTIKEPGHAIVTVRDLFAEMEHLGHMASSGPPPVSSMFTSSSGVVSSNL